MFALELDNLVKKYNDFYALKGVSFSVKKGEIFSLLGENGAGKTTLIKIVCGLSEKTSGEIKINGENSDSGAERVKRIINVAPQETAVANNLTVKENLKFMAELYGVENADVKTCNIMRSLSLTEYAGKRAKTLSGGTKRRLSIGMALITEPEIVFLDEPTVGLDVRVRRELWGIIRSLKGKMTVILTTHYLEEAEALSDTMAVLSKGKIKAVGSVEEIKLQGKSSDIEQAFINLTEEEQ